MSKEAFLYLCNELSPYISKQDTNFRKAVPVGVRVAISLYFLSGSNDYRTIANLFGIGRSTVCSIVHDVTKAIVDNLMKRYIYLPNENEVTRIMKDFERLSGFPQSVAAIDGCHIRIKAPSVNLEGYINRKDYLLNNFTEISGLQLFI